MALCHLVGVYRECSMQAWGRRRSMSPHFRGAEMGIDLDLLQQHRRFEDPVAGYSETFIQPRLGGGATVGVLSRPLGPSAGTGWVICHSFGIEQVHLGRMDVIAARAM